VSEMNIPLTLDYFVTFLCRGSDWTQTLNLKRMRQMFYLYATPSLPHTLAWFLVLSFHMKHNSSRYKTKFLTLLLNT
jgi:hypothetical protein